MYLLALETSTEYCSCAVYVGDALHGEVRERSQLAGQRHSELLLPMVAELMGEAQLSFSQLDAIVFGAGPGSFTGLRIACGAAQGLAFAHALPVVPVATLEALAQESAAPRVLTSLDARLGELYLAAYEKTGEADWKVISAPALRKTTQLPELPGAWTGVGSGFAVHGQPLRERYKLEAEVPGLVPGAGAMARLGALKFSRGQALPADQAAPLYLRDKVALDVNEQAALRAAKRDASGALA
jgi:tRNA threonylcarbamoyladenosine biosynthesis protein TsaB